MRCLVMMICLMFATVMSASGQQIPPDAGTWATEWSPDGTVLAVAGPNGLVSLIGYDENVLDSFVANQPRTTALAWSPDGRTLATSGTDYFVRFWSVETGELIHELNLWAPSTTIDWQPHGTLLITATSDTIQVWDTTSFEPVTIGAGATVLDAEWRSDGSTFAYGSIETIGIAKIDGSTFGGQRLLPMDVSLRTNSVSWSFDESQIVSTGQRLLRSLADTEFDDRGSAIRIWDVEHGQEVKVLYASEVEKFSNAVFIGEFSERVVAITEEGSVYTFDVPTGEIISHVREDAFLWSVSWNPQFSLIAIGGTRALNGTQGERDPLSTSFLQMQMP